MINRRRETYVGQWLPEPLLTEDPEDPVERLDSSSMALLVVLELLELLAPDVTLWTDGGGKGAARSLQPVHGRDRVAELFIAVSAASAISLDIHYRTVNGDPSAVLFTGDAPFAVLVLDLTPPGDRIAGIYSVTNPDKLTRITPREHCPSCP
ncbi:hypothetical protein [Kribbella sp. DT2]|uniref:hypothetical protein n=1 Tax=Kribbella sp. DT2 TaxID=3393427 RepID=UPI003CE6D7F9